MSDNIFDLTDQWGPEKVVCVSDQRTGMRGVLVIDNSARGMGKGGTRMSPTVTVTEVARLARAMTWKWARTEHGDDCVHAYGGAYPADQLLELDVVLHERGIALVPDFIPNAGGIVAAAYSMDARRSPFPVDPADVLATISSKMVRTAMVLRRRLPVKRVSVTA